MGIEVRRRSLEILPQEVAPTSARRRVEILPADTSAAPAIHVVAPATESTVHSALVTIRGYARGPSEVCLVAPDLHVVRVPERGTGSFQFADVQLRPRLNELSVGMHSGGCMQGDRRVPLRVHYRDPFLELQSRDPLTKRPLAAGDAVVRCHQCLRYFHWETAQDDPACAYCGGTTWVSESDPLYYAPNPRQRRQHR